MKLYILAALVLERTLAFSTRRSWGSVAPWTVKRARGLTVRSTSEKPVETAAPSLDGKRILPFKILSGSLAGQPPLAAVYAVMDQTYKRGQDGWSATVHVGVTQDLVASLNCHVDEQGKESVAHVRALTFAVPQPNAMQKIASDWKGLAKEAGASVQDWGDDILGYLYDGDDDDEDDEEFEDMVASADSVAAMNGGEVVSPFELPNVAVTTDKNDALEFTAENVDTVLNEVRPYLIADGGNVVVERVDAETRKIYLKLEGACGSCESSTVTMQMGVERVLRENFADIAEVCRVEDDPLKPTSLTYEAVQEEVSRLGTAIIAMGGVMRLLDVDTSTGVVKILFKGPAKVQSGLELALRDVKFVTDVIFTDEE